jgi:hypothetical protein
MTAPVVKYNSIGEKGYINRSAGLYAILYQKQFTEDPASEGSNILVWFGSLYVLPSPGMYCEAQWGTVGEPV